MYLLNSSQDMRPRREKRSGAITPSLKELQNGEENHSYRYKITRETHEKFMGINYRFY